MRQADLFGVAPAKVRLFDGPDLTPDDHTRLDGQHERIKRLMLDGQWRSLEAISEATGAPAASVSAQLRHLRKPRFGEYQVDRRHLGQGLYEYRVTP
jgi:hypothetical protein